MAAPLLEIDALSVAFGSRVAVDGVSLRIGSGEVVALVGESGCGKSVTSLATMGLLPDTARIAGGRIAFTGRDGRTRDLATLTRRELRAIRGDEMAMIFQEPMTSLNPVHRIGDQIGEVLLIHRGLGRRAARAEAAELLALVGLPDPVKRLDAFPHELSGGMRQRVVIAIALACRPLLLIADEPTTALDVTVQAQILELIRGLQRDFAMGVLFITHDLGVVAEIADRVAVMYAGRIAEEGSAREVLKRAGHPYTRGLLGAIPRLEGGGEELLAIPGMVPDLAALPAGCRFHPRCFASEPGRCDREAPTLAAVAPGHAVSCLRRDELDRHAA